MTMLKTDLQLLLCLLVLILPPYQPLGCIDCIERICDRLHHIQCMNGIQGLMKGVTSMQEKTVHV